VHRRTAFAIGVARGALSLTKLDKDLSSRTMRTASDRIISYRENRRDYEAGATEKALINIPD
jgi:hypothetical protein